jgi:hypothetical protein
MKKLFSISLAFIMLVSGLKLTISQHYCGGELADVNVSLTGHVASCGMETATNDCTHASTIEESGCCKNKVSVYEIDQTYSPTFTEFKAFSQTVLQIFVIPENITFHSLTDYSLAESGFISPRNFLVTAISLPKICVFRI